MNEGKIMNNAEGLTESYTDLETTASYVLTPEQKEREKKLFARWRAEEKKRLKKTGLLDFLQNRENR